MGILYLLYSFGSFSCTHLVSRPCTTIAVQLCPPHLLLLSGSTVRVQVLRIGHALSWCRIGWRCATGSRLKLCRAGRGRTRWREHICIDFLWISRPICLSHTSSITRIKKAVPWQNLFVRGFFHPQFYQIPRIGHYWDSWRTYNLIFLTWSSRRTLSAVPPLHHFPTK